MSGLPKTTTPGPWNTSPAPKAAPWFPPEEWCEPSPTLLGHACEKYLRTPIWWSVVVADVVGLWFIAAILLRQRQQTKERLQRRQSLPKSLRIRRDWSAVAAAVRLASLGAGGREAPQRGAWSLSWERVAKARQERKDHMDKKDYNITAVMTRASGPLIVTVVCILIAWETHAFYTVVLPWLALGEETTKIVGYALAVVPARIYFDYARTTLTDPGRPEAEEALTLAAAYPMLEVRLTKATAEPPLQGLPALCAEDGPPLPRDEQLHRPPQPPLLLLLLAGPAPRHLRPRGPPGAAGLRGSRLLVEADDVRPPGPRGQFVLARAAGAGLGRTLLDLPPPT
eukprot:CAMPEP_0115483160 /NCGR_PEP_ID=MMETSP0271-20121206/58709_1 /TAXON_ID=71861 /ORGANISM="Scrippsiella trochoidea, Strain CCMP3099" /LENGTH=339 /DNA_ID=CAMNT_0002910995 /DNA_START=39 /DNA_END=1056 /DNA_ORIENTATION=-